MIDSARRFEVWESFVAGRLGLGIALDQAIERGIAPTAAYIVWLSSLARERLRAIDGVIVADPPAADSGIVTFVAAVRAPARGRGIGRSRHPSCVDPGRDAQWDLAARGHDAVVRASFHVYNDVADIDALALVVEQIAAGRMASKL